MGAASTLPSVRSQCDICWPNTARVGHYLDETIQVRDTDRA